MRKSFYLTCKYSKNMWLLDDYITIKNVNLSTINSHFSTM